MTWKEALTRWMGHGSDTNAGAAPTAAYDDGEPFTCEQRVRTALREVEDPELGLNIVDLGLVYAVEATEDRVRADISMTTPTCPLGEAILDDARAAIGRALPDVADLQVRLVWEPPWTPSMMSDDARKHLGW